MDHFFLKFGSRNFTLDSEIPSASFVSDTPRFRFQGGTPMSGTHKILW
jgi:hypothetical protein